MQRKKQVAPHVLRKTDTPRPSLLFVGITASARCRRFGNPVETDGPLTPHLISRILPDAVVLSLMSNNRDAVEDLETLSALGFRGRCLVLAPKLPNRKMVLKELRHHAAGLRLTLLIPQA